MAVSFTFYVTSVAALDKVAQALAPFLQADDCLSLSGDLGAGKNTFTAALVRALGLADSVTSPSFNLLHEYSEPCKGVRLFRSGFMYCRVGRSYQRYFAALYYFFTLYLCGQ